MAAIVVIMIGRNRGEVHHHDGVLLHDTYQEEHPDQRDQREVVAQQQQGQQRAQAGRRQRRQEGQRMHEAFIQNAQHDIHRDQRRQDQPGLVLHALLEVAGVAAQPRLDG
ncbi:hypothetical protein G6F32_016392 [Rhizopus arrhizus]|nr:hypothetical protein G6F32_016392 [Rhizopus arrhizus]